MVFPSNPHVAAMACGFIISLFDEILMDRRSGYRCRGGRRTGRAGNEGGGQGALSVFKRCALKKEMAAGEGPRQKKPLLHSLPGGNETNNLSYGCGHHDEPPFRQSRVQLVKKRKITLEKSECQEECRVYCDKLSGWLSCGNCSASPPARPGGDPLDPNYGR